MAAVPPSRVVSLASVAVLAAWLSDALARGESEEMVTIPAGCHEVGCPESACRRMLEAPRRRVCLDAYRIDRTEVTVGQYRACEKAGTCTAISELEQPRDGADETDRSRHPVVGVTWAQAEAYCRWRGQRLPTEAEWERAARGPVADDRAFPWGADPPLPTCAVAVLAFDEEGPDCAADGPQQRPFTRPVCSRPKGNSPEGLCDMTGNAAEWTSDWYLSAFSRRGGAGKNPAGPCPGKRRCPGARGHVIKGGGWIESELFARIHTRSPPWKPHVPRQAGFRCAVSSPTGAGHGSIDRPTPSSDLVIEPLLRGETRRRPIVRQRPAVADGSAFGGDLCPFRPQGYLWAYRRSRSGLRCASAQTLGLSQDSPGVLLRDP